MQPEITLRQFVGAYPNPTYQSDSDLCIFNRDFFFRYLLMCTLYIFICTRVSNVCLREHFWEQEENSKQHPSGCIYTIELMKITVSKIQVCDLQGLRFDFFVWWLFITPKWPTMMLKGDMYQTLIDCNSLGLWRIGII